MDNLDASLGTTGDNMGRRALVIGAGGAARAVVAGLQDRAFGRIVVANRTLAKADELVAEFWPCRSARRSRL